MKKNVLVISGSPRKKGNSDLLCDRFIQGAKDSGHDAEKISLRELTVNYCLACDACRKNGDRCVQKDDMAEVLEKMIAADVLVLATPVYFYTMAAQVKTLIDRTYPRYKEIRDKDLYIILTAAEHGTQIAQRTVEGIRGFFHFLPGCREKGIVYGTGAWEKGDILGHKAMDEAYEFGKKS